MRALLQRVSSAQVRVGGRPVGRIGHGLVVFLGVGRGDGLGQVRAMVEKISHLRLFENDQGKLDRSLLDVRGAVLAVSQFTLYADCRKGRRPSFTEAAPPEVASTLIDRFLEEMAQRGVAVSSGRFGQHMEVSLVNDGPVTVWLDIPPGGQAGSGARGEIYGG